MPFDSNGYFTRLHNWEDDRQNDIDIVSDRHDEEDDNFADGLSECLLKDGRATMSGNLKMGNFQIKGLAKGAADTDAVNREQLDDSIGDLSKKIFSENNTYSGENTYTGTTNFSGNVKIGTGNAHFLDKVDGQIVDRTFASEVGSSGYDSPAVVVSTYRSGETWYRKWSDGFIEQGGIAYATSSQTTVNFPMAFKDTNYTILTKSQSFYNSDQNQRGDAVSYITGNVKQRNTGNFILCGTSGYSPNGYCWYACGY